MSADWKNSNNHFIEGTCLVTIDSNSGNFADGIAIEVTTAYDLGKSTEQFPLSVFNMTALQTQTKERINLYTYDEKKGKATRANDKLLLPGMGKSTINNTDNKVYYKIK